ncbi:D-histidine (S)-2-aminobutanoyltransferase CntL [Staphylococcus aureus]
MNNFNNEIKLILQQYLEKFEAHYERVLQDDQYIEALETLMDDYSEFILNPIYEQQFNAWRDVEKKAQLIKSLQYITAQCVKQVEVIRARRLLDGQASTTGYFDNIEHCIDEEFGQCSIASHDKLLLVGSGAYPMTLIQVAKETGASVIGIDIDPQAVDLGRRIVNVLAPNEDITITDQKVSELKDIKDVTHIIFSSTIPLKYSILEELYDLTNENVVVAMRFGDGIKAIFNYPSQETAEDKWQCVNKHMRPQQIFDIALYKKATIKVGITDV